MKLKKAVKEFLKTKESLSSFAVYNSYSKVLMFNLELDELDLVGDLKVSERKVRIARTRRIFSKIEDKMQGKSQNTKFFVINMFKSVLKNVEETDGSSFWKAFKVKQHKNDIVIIPPDFVRAFLSDDHNIYEGLPQKLKTIWELSAIMMVSALRFSDASAVNGSNLRSGKIVIKNQKTGVVTSSPIPDSLSQKLNNNLILGSVFSAKLSKDEYYNLYPELFKLYEEMRTEINGVPLYDCTRYHLFRKSSISLMLSQGIPESIVKRLSGHSANSRSFDRYVSFNETMYNSQVEEWQNKFYS